MPENISNMVMVPLFMGVSALAAVSIITKAVKNKYATVKTGKAVVVDKHKIETLCKYSGTGKREKICCFYGRKQQEILFISQFSYAGYKIGERGTLKYKGERIIAFK